MLNAFVRKKEEVIRMNESQNLSSLMEAIRQKINQHDISGALALLLEQKETQTQDAERLHLIANCYYVLGNVEEAERYWSRLVQEYNGDETARARIEQLHSPAFQFWVKRYQQALNEIEARNYSQARKMLRELLEEQDGFVKMYQLLGLCYLAEGKADQARQCWKRGLSIDVSNEVLIQYLNSSQTTKKSLAAEGKSIPEKGRRISPIISGASMAWGMTALLLLAFLIQAGMSASSDRVSESSIHKLQQQVASLTKQLDNTDMVTPVMADNIGAGQQNVETGVDKNAHNGNERELFDSGYKAYQNGDYGRAAAELGSIVEMATHSYLNREALYYLARTYYLQDNFDKAEKYYSLFLKEFPESNYYDDSLFYLGCIYHSRGENDQAYKSFSILQEIAPDSGYASSEVCKNVLGQGNK